MAGNTRKRILITMMMMVGFTSAASEDLGEGVGNWTFKDCIMISMDAKVKLFSLQKLHHVHKSMLAYSLYY